MLLNYIFCEIQSLQNKNISVCLHIWYEFQLRFFFVVCLHIWYDSTDFFSVCLHIWYTVNSGIEARLLFNFWTFVAVFYLSFCQFLCNKSPNFHYFSVFYSRSLLFGTVFYSRVYCMRFKNSTGRVRIYISHKYVRSEWSEKTNNIYQCKYRLFSDHSERIWIS